jgi:hypothetical protein
VGQDEDPHALVRRADFCRTEQARRRRVAHVPKLSQHGFKTEADVTGDVLNEDPFGAAFSDDAGNIWPEVAWIVGTAALSCCAERLAGISGQHCVEGTAEGPCVEAAQVVPNWGRGEVPFALGCDEDGAGPVFPFDKCAGVKTGLGEHEAQIEASAACAEGQSMPGT